MDCFRTRLNETNTSDHDWKLTHLFKPLCEGRHGVAEPGVETELECGYQAREKVHISEGKSLAIEPDFAR